MRIDKVKTKWRMEVSKEEFHIIQVALKEYGYILRNLKEDFELAEFVEQMYNQARFNRK